jgi:hypothetical protein
MATAVEAFVGLTVGVIAGACMISLFIFVSFSCPSYWRSGRRGSV